MRLRRPAIAAVVTATALLLSGCLGINSTSSVQSVPLGDVTLTSVVCANEAPGCPTGSSSPPYGVDNDPSVPRGMQLMYAVRLPVGATAPSSFDAELASGSALAMAQDPSYEQQLQLYAPAGEGDRWWGYVSEPFLYSASSDQKVVLGIDVSTGADPQGEPLATPLAWRPVVGARFADDTYPADRPVQCVPQTFGTAFEANPEGDGTGRRSIVCIDSPDRTTTTGAPLEAAFTDLALTGTPASVAAGGTVQLGFTARRNDGSSPVGATLSATGPAGVTLTPSTRTLSLSGPTTTDLAVQASVAPGTPAGSYPVTLTATAPGGETRTATVALVVSGAAGATQVPAPKKGTVRLKVSKVGVRTVRTVWLRLSRPSTVTAVVRGVAGGSFRAKVVGKRSAGRVSLRLPFLEHARYKVRVVARDGAGHRSRFVTTRFTAR